MEHPERSSPAPRKVIPMQIDAFSPREIKCYGGGTKSRHTFYVYHYYRRQMLSRFFLNWGYRVAWKYRIRALLLTYWEISYGPLCALGAIGFDDCGLVEGRSVQRIILGLALLIMFIYWMQGMIKRNWEGSIETSLKPANRFRLTSFGVVFAL